MALRSISNAHCLDICFVHDLRQYLANRLSLGDSLVLLRQVKALIFLSVSSEGRLPSNAYLFR